MSENYTSTQCFPSGRMIRHAGSYPHYSDESGNEFDSETQDELHAQLLAETYVERDVLCCDSALVEDLQSKDMEGFFIEDMENLYPDPSSWTVKECREYIEDHGGDFPSCNPWEMDGIELLETLDDDSVSSECGTVDKLRQAVIGAMDDETIDGIDDWRNAVSDCAEPAEPYEWWRVSSWLCGQLRDIGEVVIDNGYGHWWGRTCTGQSMIMDGTLQAVARKFL